MCVWVCAQKCVLGFNALVENNLVNCCFSWINNSSYFCLLLHFFAFCLLKGELNLLFSHIQMNCCRLGCVVRNGFFCFVVAEKKHRFQDGTKLLDREWHTHCARLQELIFNSADGHEGERISLCLLSVCSRTTCTKSKLKQSTHSHFDVMECFMIFDMVYCTCWTQRTVEISLDLKWKNYS